MLAATPQLLGDRVGAGIEGLTNASPVWIWLAGAAFAGSLRVVRSRMAIGADALRRVDDRALTPRRGTAPARS